MAVALTMYPWVRSLYIQNDVKVISVVRDGEQMRINISDLVVGDVALLAQGAIIPADGILVCLATDCTLCTFLVMSLHWDPPSVSLPVLYPLLSCISECCNVEIIVNPFSYTYSFLL